MLIALAGLLAAGCGRQQACPEPSPGPAIAGRGDAQATALLAARPLAELSCWAQQDNQLAQHALGLAYEKGIGVRANQKAALRYYRAAARTIPDRVFVYVPPVGEKTSGRVMPVNTGQGRPGLPEAKDAVRRMSSVKPE